MSCLADLLRDPSVRNLDADAGDRLRIHAAMLARKPMLQRVFAAFHDTFDRLDRSFLSGQGSRIELGAGVAPIRDSYPDVLATDVVAGVGLDRVLDAEDMDLPDASVRVLFGQNCFHHFPHPKRFFEELERVCVPGGGAILLEPYFGPLASYLFQRMFRSEGYDKQFPSWNTPSTGPMNGANQALSYIVFERDRSEFERLFPRLQIVHRERCDYYLMYLLSGGLNFRQMFPARGWPLLAAIEAMLASCKPWVALHHVVVIRKMP